MGFWERVGRGLRDELTKVARESGGPRPAARRAAAQVTPEHLRGPDPGALLTAGDIAAATGSPPVGEGDRRGGGTETDVGFFRVCIWQLADGGQLIVNSTRFRGEEGLELWRSRWDDPSWKDADTEHPLEGVSDVARWYVQRSPKGGTELHVDAKQGDHSTSLVHTDPGGTKDPAPLARLMVALLDRLGAAG